MRKIKERDMVCQEDFEFLEGIPFDRKDELLGKNDLITWDACSLYRKVSSEAYQRGINLELWGKERVYRVPPEHRLYEVGDIMPVGQCEKGWEIEYVQASTHQGREGNWVDKQMIGDCRIVSGVFDTKVRYSNGMSCDLDVIVKLISKGSEKEETPKPTKSHDEEILEAVCSGGPSRETQSFKVPGDFLVEMLSKIGGMPLDIVCDSDESLIYCDSVEFKSDMEPIQVIRTADGWKVEGT